MLFHLWKDKKWKTINIEFVSYFLLIQSKKIKRHIGHFYPNITLKNLFKTKKIEETLALKYYIPTNKFYRIFTFFYIQSEKKNKWKIFPRTSPFIVEIIKKSRCKLCQNFFDRHEQILDKYQLSNLKFHLTSRA